MSDIAQRTDAHLQGCGCCAGLTALTPAPLRNRPGLAAVAYRVGTHAGFKRTMLARLSSSGLPALAALRTRDDQDFSIALLDAWATVADVLTFYQERFANESFLRTSTERLSLLQLARLIGYQLSPGVAASAYLAFTLEEAEGAPQATTIAVGTKVNSTPGPDEKPQTFETVEKIEARPAWNAIKPRLSAPLQLSTALTSFYLEGATADLKPGDTVLIAAGSQAADRAVKRVASVTPDEDRKVTRVELEAMSAGIKAAGMLGIVVELAAEIEISGGSGGGAAGGGPALPAAEALFSTEADLTDATLQKDILGKTWKSEDLLALAAAQGWSVPEMAAGIAGGQPKLALTPETGIFVFRQRGSLFGYNAPKKVTYTNGVPNAPEQWTEWTPDTGEEAAGRLFLDSTYEKVVSRGYVAVQKPGEAPKAYPLQAVVVQPRTQYGVSAKSTVLTLASGQAWWDPTKDGFGVIRGTTVYLQSESLKLAQTPLSTSVGGQSVLLNGYYPYLKTGQRIVLTGKPTDQKTVTRSELATLSDVEVDGNGFTKLTLEKPLKKSYVRDSVTISANVALATHGETVREVLGSGDAGQPYPRFALRQSPLTYVSSSSATGATSTLEVRVNDLLWSEVPTLYGRGPNDRVYVTQIDDEGTTTVLFGDGLTGRRLPSGRENVQATYRKGIGLDGLVKAKQLDQLMTRPLGVKEVVNPLAADGGADREDLSEARENAPLTVLTLDRVVSLQDYEDFARAFAGIAKALATWTWNGRARGVFLTVAGAKGAEVKSDSTLYENLLAALRKAGDPYVRIQVRSYRKAFFRLAGSLKVDPAYETQKVLASVKAALRSRFSFAARAFGQPVVLSEVIAAMQAVSGVVSVDIDKFHRTDQPAAWNERLVAALPEPGATGDNAAAELLTLDPSPLEGLEALP